MVPGRNSVEPWEVVKSLSLQAQEMLHKPPLIYSLRDLPEARGRPGLRCKDFAVLSTHVLDLASL